MKALMDTCTLLWALMEPQRLSLRSQEILRNPDDEVFVSPVSYWEISLKYSIGKLALQGILPDEIPDLCLNSGFRLLAWDSLTIASSHRLPFIDGHKDPFDRMLIWTAIQNKICLISSDTLFDLYSDHGLIRCW